MNLTLWLLNRVVAWESDPNLAQPLQAALAAGGHRVQLGQRVAASHPQPLGMARLQVQANSTESSALGELMHEGPLQLGSTQRTAYDEYFVPIPLKCLGAPDYDGDGCPVLPEFWAKRVTDPLKRQALLQIFAPAVNPCFEQAGLSKFREAGLGNPAVKPTRPLEPAVPPAPATDQARPAKHLVDEFTDVRLNLSPEFWSGGYYRILAESAARHGPNVLVGYSQGGTVAQFLAYVDEHLVDETKRCIHGVVAVQAPLRGSTLAMASRAADVAQALHEAVLSVRGQALLRKLFVPAWLKPVLDPLLVPGKVPTVAQINRAIDIAWQANQGGDLGILEVLKTSRKWLSGLSGCKELAFYDLDCSRLGEAGSVLHALHTQPLVATRQGGVAGTCSELTPLAEQLMLDRAPWLRWVRWPLRWGLPLVVGQSERILRERAMDMMPEPSGGAELRQLRQEWLAGRPGAGPGWRLTRLVLGKALRDVAVAKLPARSGDFVIPAASQVVAGGVFLRNYVNEDASHLSGATLIDQEPRDLLMVERILAGF